jgi:cell shape-determining protein MreC
MNNNFYIRPRQGKKKGWGRQVMIILGMLLILSALVYNQAVGSVFSNVIAFFAFSNSSEYQALPKSVLASRLAHAEEELSRTKYQALLYTLEVERNKQILDSFNLSEREVIARGEVIARPPRTHYDTLLVSLVPNTGVSVGDRVYASGILIGDVAELRQGGVLVSLFSTPGRTLDVRIGTPSAIVVMHGLGGGSFVFEIPKNVEIGEGDMILAGHGQEALIARVQYIVDEPEKTTVRVYAASPISMPDTTFVEFEKGSPMLEEVL